MVKIQIKRNRDGHVLTFYADGHSDAGDYGSDIVCAAISAVMQTALLGLGEHVKLEQKLKYNIDADGWLYCELPHDLSVDEQVRADAIIETMILGLKSIETEYSDNIMVEEEVE